MLIPIFELFYNKKNITRDVSPYVTAIEYIDNEHGSSDELSISFGIVHCYEHKDLSFVQMIKLADKLMYEEKDKYYKSNQ